MWVSDEDTPCNGFKIDYGDDVITLDKVYS